MTWLAENFRWMFWTVPSALFILGIIVAVITLSIISKYKPNVDRKGFLPIETGRGDRLFIGVLSNILFLLVYIGIFSGNFLIIAAIIMVIWFFSLQKWG